MPKYKKAGADAAGAYDDEFKKIIQNDPDIQRVIQGVWGDGPRPSDTPKNLEKQNDQASKQITQILKSKGVNLPDRTFVNPRSGALEGHRGWSGLSGIQKAAIIAAAAATGVGGLAAAGALGGGAAAGAAGGAAASGGAGAGGVAGLGAGLGVASGLPAGMAGVGATGFGLGGTAVGGGLTSSMLTNAGINAAKTKLTGGSWKDAALSGGLGAVTGGAAGGGGNMGWADIAKSYGKDLAKDTAKDVSGSLVNQLLSGRTLSATGQGLGAIGQTQAHNRGVALDAMMAGDEMKILADRERRAAEADLMKKIQTTSYLKGGGFKDTGPATSVSGKPLGKFDFGVRPASESEMTMATELEGQLMNRLRNPIELSDYASKMDPGKMETALNWLGPILSGVGEARTPDTNATLQQLFRQYGNNGAQPTPTPQAPPTPQGSSAPVDEPRWGTFEPATPNRAGKPSFQF
jgi:hypothetical protein